MNAMVNYFVTCGLLLLCFMGCAPVASFSTEAVPTSTVALVPTTIPFSSPTALTPTKQHLKFYFPEVEKRCSENREVSFDGLGVREHPTVILSDLGQTGLWKYSVENPKPILIYTYPLGKWTRFILNPTGEKLAFLIRNQDNSSSIWLLSLNSGDKRRISSINYFEGAYPNIQWISNNELLVTGSCAGAGCPFPIKILNITNGIEVNVEDTFSTPYDSYIGFIADEGEYWALYSSYADDGYTQFYVYDYTASRKLNIFPWLDGKIFFYPLIGTNFGLINSDKNFAMTVEQSYGFDVGVLSPGVEKITQGISYEAVMKRVVTEVQFSELDYVLFGLNPSNKNLLMKISYTDYLNNNPNDDLTTTPSFVGDALFAVDLQNHMIDGIRNEIIFIDYCFVTTGYIYRGLSPAGQIAVFSTDHEILFLNLETGNISRLSDWSFVGWTK
jgi:hypothetical protein